MTDAAETPHTATTHPVMRLLEVMRDLDRCPHGRHQGDVCGDCETGTSQGNPILPTGMHIGYGLYGDPIYMPDRDGKHDPDAWFKPPTQPATHPPAREGGDSEPEDT